MRSAENAPRAGEREARAERESTDSSASYQLGAEREMRPERDTVEKPLSAERAERPLGVERDARNALADERLPLPTDEANGLSKGVISSKASKGA